MQGKRERGGEKQQPVFGGGVRRIENAVARAVMRRRQPEKLRRRTEQEEGNGQNEPPATFGALAERPGETERGQIEDEKPERGQKEQQRAAFRAAEMLRVIAGEQSQRHEVETEQTGVRPMAPQNQQRDAGKRQQACRQNRQKPGRLLRWKMRVAQQQQRRRQQAEHEALVFAASSANSSILS